MKLTLLLCSSFIFSSHPIVLIMIMILTTLTLNMYMYMYMKYSWFIMVIMLLILGGLLVIFLYITSLTPNKKFKFNKFFYFLAPLVMLIQIHQVTNSNNNFQIHTLFVSTTIYMLIFILIYLILTLITIMMMIKSSMAPLKSAN